MADPELDSFPTLLAAARRGDRAAWDQLYRRFAPSVLGYLRSQRVDDPTDLLADVWLQVVRDLATFDGAADGFKAWILRIAHNRLVDVRRSDSRRPAEVFVAQVPEQLDDGDPEPPIEDPEELERLFAGIPPTQRAVLYLRYVLDMPQNEIAMVLGSSVPAVKMQQRRGIDAISARLGEGTDA